MDKDTNKFRGMATVRFEHPVESVQAICILHCGLTWTKLMLMDVYKTKTEPKPGSFLVVFTGLQILTINLTINR